MILSNILHPLNYERIRDAARPDFVQLLTVYQKPPVVYLYSVHCVPPSICSLDIHIHIHPGNIQVNILFLSVCVFIYARHAYTYAMHIPICSMQRGRAAVYACRAYIHICSTRAACRLYVHACSAGRVQGGGCMPGGRVCCMYMQRGGGMHPGACISGGVSCICMQHAGRAARMRPGGAAARWGRGGLAASVWHNLLN